MLISEDVLSYDSEDISGQEPEFVKRADSGFCPVCMNEKKLRKREREPIKVDATALVLLQKY